MTSGLVDVEQIGGAHQSEVLLSSVPISLRSDREGLGIIETARSGTGDYAFEGEKRRINQNSCELFTIIPR